MFLWNLKNKKFIVRKKITGNNKNIIISITHEGMKLKEKAKLVPKQMGKCLNISENDGKELKEILKRIMKDF